MSYSQTEHSNNGLTSLSPITVDLTTSACQGRSLTVSESELSTSTAFVRLRNTVQDTTYTTTFTSLKTLFTIATITASPTPTIVTTSTPYLTETEVITTTVVVHNSADVTATTMVPASKADGVSRLSKAQIGGIIAGAVGLFTVLAAILICLILRKRRRNFALDSQNKKPCTEVDAEMTNEIDGRNLRQSMIGQVPTSSSSSVDMNNHSDEEHSTESSSYLTAQTVTTEFLVSESPDLSVDPTSRRMSQSSRMAYEKEIERLRQEILSQAERIRYMDEQMELMQPRSPPPPSYHSSRRSAISTQTSRSSLSQPPPLPSREISY
ncbi:hypothetical protein EDD18DRAFT_1102947 [Armillaria luteobubalina]|uniref:Mid2 domain-containing protein n=1 Tax=Armillaria luteobubalina TaxID=153913 RepID=A0AA39QD16_9AGAR|nr:hypothetical protein EDD18DRAFT_1102947 [Armillaria luteobubalina]